MICSSNKEYITTAPMPASSSRRTISTFFESGEAEATSGFFKCSPRYVVVKSSDVIVFLLQRYCNVALQPTPDTPASAPSHRAWQIASIPQRVFRHSAGAYDSVSRYRHTALMEYSALWSRWSRDSCHLLPALD